MDELGTILRPDFLEEFIKFSDRGVLIKVAVNSEYLNEIYIFSICFWFSVTFSEVRIILNSNESHYLGHLIFSNPTNYIGNKVIEKNQNLMVNSYAKCKLLTTVSIFAQFL